MSTITVHNDLEYIEAIQTFGLDTTDFDVADFDPSLSLYVSPDDSHWYVVSFTGESLNFVDREAATWLAANPHLIAVLDEASTHWSDFPLTFNAVLEQTLAEGCVELAPAPAYLYA